jgi:hypothetical protein
MKQSSIIFFQVVIVLIGILTLAYHDSVSPDRGESHKLRSVQHLF